MRTKIFRSSGAPLFVMSTEEVMEDMDEALCVSSLRLSLLVYCENTNIMTLPSTMKLASTMTMVTRRYFPNRDFCKGNPSFRPAYSFTSNL